FQRRAAPCATFDLRDGPPGRVRVADYILRGFLPDSAFLPGRFCVFLFPAWAAISSPVAAADVLRASLTARAGTPAPTSSFGSFCFSLRVGSNKSPIFCTRLRTCPASNASKL